MELHGKSELFITNMLLPYVYIQNCFMIIAVASIWRQKWNTGWETTNDSDTHFTSWHYLSYLKGIVKWDLTGVETRLKHSVLLSYSVGKFSFWILIFSWEKYKTGFSVLTTIEFNLPVEFTKSCKRRPPYNDLRNLAYTGWWSYGTTPVPYNHQPAQISWDRWILSMYGTILHRTIILCPGTIPYCHQPAQAGFCVSQILARSS